MLAGIELEGGEQLAAAWGQAPEKTAAKLMAFMHGATMYLEGEIKERVPTAHGLLRASFNSDVQELADGVLGVVGSPLSYALPVELGTRPHFPPVEALMDWVRVKLGVPESEVRNVAFLGARKIAARGTQPAYMVRDAAAAAQPEIERQFAIAVAELLAELQPGGEA